MRKKVSLIVSVFVVIASITIGSIIIVNSLKNGTKMSEKEYNKQLDSYNKQIIEINNEKINEFKKYGITNRYNELQEQYSKLTRLKSDLTFRYNRTNSGNYDLFKIFPGFFIIVFGMTLSVVLYKFINFNLKPLDLSNMTIVLPKSDNEEEEYVTFKCPNCGNTNLKGKDQEKCEYCGSLLQKVKKKR